MADPVKIEAKRERNRRHYLANREALLEKKRLQRLDPEVAERRREYDRRYRADNPEKGRERNRRHAARNANAAWARNLLRQFGLTPDDYAAMLEAQAGVCAVCDAPPNGQRLAVDHDHETGRIRKLLCRDCNLGIGHFRDDADRLSATAEYLRNH